VLQELFIDGLATILDRQYGPFQKDGVPADDSGGHQINAGGATALVLKAAVAHLAEPVEEYSPGQRANGGLKVARRRGRVGGAPRHWMNRI